MTRDRRRPPLLESLEGKQLLSTFRPSLGMPTAGVVRQPASADVHMAVRPSTLGNLTAGFMHSRVGQSAGHFATGRMAVLNSLGLGLIGRSISGGVANGNVQGPNRLDLRAGMLSPAARMAAVSTSAAPMPGSSSRIIQSTPPPPKPVVTTTAPTAQSTLAQTLALHGNLL